MKNPKRTVEKAVARYFPVHGQQTICLTPSEFEHRWSKVCSDVADRLYRSSKNLTNFGSIGILLEPSKAKLLTRVAWIHEGNATYVGHEQKKTVRQVDYKMVRVVRPPRQRKDGYDCMRINESDKLSWKRV